MAWGSREQPTRHHWQAEVADWRMAEMNDIQLMFCIQNRGLDTFDRQGTCATGADYYASLRAAHPRTSKEEDRRCSQSLNIPPRYPHACNLYDELLTRGDRALTD